MEFSFNTTDAKTDAFGFSTLNIFSLKNWLRSSYELSKMFLYNNTKFSANWVYG